MSSGKSSKGHKVICYNKTARLHYEIGDTYEAGIILQGTEVKSLRLGKANFRDSYAALDNSEAFLYDFHISPYTFGNRYNHEPLRVRKLLLHKGEIKRLYGKTREKGLSLIPLQLYFKRGKVKVELGVAKGKKLYDKRADLMEKAVARDTERAFRERDKG